MLVLSSTEGQHEHGNEETTFCFKFPILDE